MEVAFLSGQMEHVMTANLLKIKGMVKANKNGLMVRVMSGNFNTTYEKALGDTRGIMARYTMIIIDLFDRLQHRSRLPPNKSILITLKNRGNIVRFTILKHNLICK